MSYTSSPVAEVVVVVHVLLVEEVWLELVKMVELRRVVELGRMIMVMLVAVIQLGQVVVVVMVLVVKSEVSLGEKVRNSMYCIAVLRTYYLLFFQKLNKLSLQ